MKITCRYSGVEFRVEHFNFNSIGEHPLFHLPIDRILGLFRIWVNQDENPQTPRLSETETRLLFVALLKSTDLVLFETPAMPTFQTATRHLPQLGEFVAFLQTVGNPETRFPHININSLTSDCQNAGQWLKIWSECQADYLDNYQHAQQNLKLQHMEELLTKLIKSPMGNQSRKISRLAQWAMIASNAPKGLQEYWTSLFKLKGLELYQASTVDLEELLEHMEDNLPAGSMFAFETLRHIRELYARNKKGIFFALGGDLDEEIDVFDMEKNPYRFVEDDIESINTRIAASRAPVTEPKLENYPNKLAYLRALSAFRLAQQENAVQREIEKREQEYLAKAALENPGTDENDEENEIDNIIRNGG